MGALRTLPTVLISALLVLVLSSVASADGVMIPRPIPRVLPRPEPFSVRYHHVDVTIENQAATTVIDQVFVNENDRDIEGTYIFPIPEAASITDFAMWMNGERVTGELLDADEARRIYSDIVRRMMDPGLLEYAGRDAYRARVYPIPANGEVKIEMSYQEVLDFDEGIVTYRYPLNTERFSARPLDDVSITVEIASSVPIKSLYSPSHDVDPIVSGLTASCGYEDFDVRPDRDFFLYYTVSAEDLGLNLLSHKAAREDGYFLLLLSPGRIDDPGEIVPKDVVFVIDRSGSMKGDKIEQAKSALAYSLEHLNDGDRFNVITFATQVRVFDEGLVSATEGNVLDALGFVRKVEAGGSTNIDEALGEALRLPESGRPQMVVFLTDGLPTAGERDVGTILENAAERNGADARVFAFGVGYDVNTTLLDELALGNRGTVDYVKPGQDIEQAITSFYDKISMPILADISVEVDGVEVYDTYPIDLPDVFNGTQALVFGRYEGSGTTAIRLTGRVGDREERLVYEASFPARSPAYDFIPPLWASRKIAYLMTEIRIRGEEEELKDEIVSLATEYGIVTPYTSFLVREDLPELTAVDIDGVRVRPITSVSDAIATDATVEQRGGSARVAGKRADEATWGSIKAAYGAPAVDMSSRLAEEREKKVEEAAETGTIRRVGRKLFYFDTLFGGWVDEAFESETSSEAEVVEIEFLSNEYFDLLDQSPEIGKYLALGESVSFMHGGVAYRVAPATG